MGNCTGKSKKKATPVDPEQVEVEGVNEAPVEHRNDKVPPRSSPKKKFPIPLPKPPPSPPSSPKAGVRLFVALFDYDARTSEDLTFKKGDYLEVSTENTQFDWWHATSRASKREGYIPSNYVAEVKTLEAEEWFYGKIGRVEAQKFLLSSGNRHGAFLIRESENVGNNFALSVRDGDVVKHYRIRALDNNQGFFISRRSEFPTLQDLVEHYKKESDGLCDKLGQPCTKSEKPQTVGLSYDTADKWEIDRSAVKFLKKLGAGNFGEVWEGLWNGTTRVAIKTLREGTMQPGAFLKEAEIMKKLIHPKLVQLYAVCSREEPIYIVTELMTKGSLLEYLHGDGRNELNMSKMIDISAQVAEGMAFLESHGFVHRDLAARNVLVGEELIVKIADFGLSRVLEEDIYEAHEGARFPIKWTAPEACLQNKFSIKSDVWSFGVLLTEITTYGRIPYPGMANAEVIRKIADTNYRMPKPAKTPEKLYAIMLKCWEGSPEERPTFETLAWQLKDFYQDDRQYREADEVNKLR